MNELLDDAGVDLRLADDGEDVGRLVTRTDEARTELLQTMTARSDPSTGDRVRHAISLFRQRGATAIAALYTVLEPHRQAGRLKAPPLNKADEYVFSFAVTSLLPVPLDQNASLMMSALARLPALGDYLPCPYRMRDVHLGGGGARA